MWSKTTTLDTIDLAIYVVLLPFTVWTFLRHGKHSLQGHLFLWVFFLLRFITDGLTMSERDDATLSEGAIVVSSIGLSPLLLALSGFDYEIRYYTHLIRAGDGRARSKIAIELFVHQIVIVGVVLLAVGYANAYSGTSDDVSKYHHLAEAGSLILSLVWLVLFFRALSSFLSNRDVGGSQAQRQLFRLSLAVLFATTIFGLRVLETVVFAFKLELQTFAENVVLMFLPQLCAVLLLVVGLAASRGLKKEASIEQDNIIRDQAPRYRTQYARR